jgi:transmembrane sensor
MNAHRESDSQVTQEAARWFGEMLDGNGRRKAFFSWLEESPRHVEELLFIMADAQDVAQLTPEQRARIDELSRELGTDAPEHSKVVPVSPVAFHSAVPQPEVTEQHPKQRDRDDRNAVELEDVAARTDTLRVQHTRGQRTAPHGALLAGAAAALLAVVGVWFWTGPGAWKTYTTKVGEQRALNLADGSIVHLNTNSVIEVRLADTSRSVRLVRGEALFSVEHDASRPFLVYTTNAVIQAIGTRFVVHQQTGKTRVAVIEGLVQVSEGTTQGTANPDAGIQPVPAPNGATLSYVRFLSAGETAEVAGGVSEPKAVDPERATAWRHRRLVFEEDSLADIANEFNRYNATIKIRVEGDAANDLFSGTFDADDPEAMMQALQGDPTLRVDRRGQEIVIRRRHGGAP